MWKHESCSTCKQTPSSYLSRADFGTCSFFAGCHLFIPLFDPEYDTYESIMERTPWTFDAILVIAAKIRSGNGPLIPTFYKCLEEAQGIARSSLFGPVVRKEAVQGTPRNAPPRIHTLMIMDRNVAVGCVEYQWLVAQWTCYENGVGSWPSSGSRKVG